MKVKTIVSGIVLAVFAFFILLPIYWLVVESVKPLGEAIGIATLFPKKFSLEGWIEGLIKEGFLEFIKNSLIISLGGVAVNIVVGLLAAYAFSRYTFKGDNHLFFWLLTNRMAPAAAFALPYYMIYTSLQLYDTYHGLILCHTIFNLPFAIWLLKGFIDAIPRELDEAAELDGYSFWSYMTKILIPMIKSGIAVTAFFVFIFSWSEFLFATILTHLSAMPLTHALFRLFWRSTTSPWNTVAAMTILSMIPGLVFLFFGERYIVRGLTFGAVR